MRQEFTAKVKLAAFERCHGRCEECGVNLRVGHTRYDHRIPDWMGGEPTLENCRVTCDICDKPKTAKDQKDIAKVKRQRMKHFGIAKPKWRSKWKRKLSGEVVLREPKP